MLVVSYLNPLWCVNDYVNDHLYVYSMNDLKSARDLCEDMCSIKRSITSPLPSKKEPSPTDTPLQPVKTRRMSF